MPQDAARLFKQTEILPLENTPGIATLHLVMLDAALCAVVAQALLRHGRQFAGQQRPRQAFIGMLAALGLYLHTQAAWQMGCTHR